jgi:acyl-CoA reductase-like NAD-dependent aldehyde dehydrogenase
MLIGGEWLGSVTSGWKPTINPADGKVIGEYAVAGEAEVNQAVVAARQAFEYGNWSEVTPAQRAKLLWRVADLIEAQGEELATLETLDGGKLLSGVRSPSGTMRVGVLKWRAELPKSPFQE